MNKKQATVYSGFFHRTPYLLDAAAPRGVPGYYWFDKVGRDRDARERYRDHPAFAMTERFCNEFDQVSFDPDYDTLPLDAFVPAVERIFAREPWGPHTQQDWPLPD